MLNNSSVGEASVFVGIGNLILVVTLVTIIPVLKKQGVELKLIDIIGLVSAFNTIGTLAIFVSLGPYDFTKSIRTWWFPCVAWVLSVFTVGFVSTTIIIFILKFLIF